MLNLTKLPLDKTARTDPECARQRAENLCVLGVSKTLELCVGPSLRVHAEIGIALGIDVCGNDIDARWMGYYPQGKWLIGDALEVARTHHTEFDAIVFAPPVTRGCTGRREDSLRIYEVTPRYEGFLDFLKGYRGVGVLVLPARSVATPTDRQDYAKLIQKVYQLGREVNILNLVAERRRIRKYVDVYIGGKP